MSRAITTQSEDGAEQRAGARADIAARIVALGGRSPSARPCELAPAVDEIRLIAHRNGLNATVTVAHFLNAALSRGERGPLVDGWLGILRDALGSERQDLQACEAFAAACSVRLSS